MGHPLHINQTFSVWMTLQLCLILDQTLQNFTKLFSKNDAALPPLLSPPWFHLSRLAGCHQLLWSLPRMRITKTNIRQTQSQWQYQTNTRTIYCQERPGRTTSSQSSQTSVTTSTRTGMRNLGALSMRLILGNRAQFFNIFKTGVKFFCQSERYDQWALRA